MRRVLSMSESKNHAEFVDALVTVNSEISAKRFMIESIMARANLVDLDRDQRTKSADKVRHLYEEMTVLYREKEKLIGELRKICSPERVDNLLLIGEAAA